MNFFIFFWFFPLKLVYFWTKSKNIYIWVFFPLICATDFNFGTKNNGRRKYSTLKTVIFASYWGTPLVQFSKFKNFLWACWFLCKIRSNFVSLPWKLHNPYCHRTIISDNFSLNLMTLPCFACLQFFIFSKVDTCIERPCLLLQKKRGLWSLKGICMIVNLNLNEFALSHPMGSRWPYFYILPIHIWYLLPCSI